MDAFLPHSGAHGLGMLKRICPQIQSQAHKNRLIVLHPPHQCTVLSLPLPDAIPHPPFLSVSPRCVQYDYVTKQKSPTRIFIGGAHLWLVLHNHSLLSADLLGVKDKYRLSGSRKLCEHFHGVCCSVFLHVAERGQQNNEMKEKNGVQTRSLFSAEFFSATRLIAKA